VVHLGILQPYIHYSVLQKLLLPLPLRSLQFQEYALITNRIRSPHIAIMKNIRSHKMSEHWRASRTILITDTAYTSITLIRIQLLLNTYSEALLTIHKPIFTRSLEKIQMKEIRFQDNSMTDQNPSCLGIVIYKIADQTEGRVKIHSDFQEFSSTENYRYVLYVNCLRKHPSPHSKPSIWNVNANSTFSSS